MAGLDPAIHVANPEDGRGQLASCSFYRHGRRRPTIHEFARCSSAIGLFIELSVPEPLEDVDARDKPGHDDIGNPAAQPPKAGPIGISLSPGRRWR